MFFHLYMFIIWMSFFLNSTLAGLTKYPILEDAKPSPTIFGTHYLSLCVFYADLHINTDVIFNPENCAFNKSLPKPIL